VKAFTAIFFSQPLTRYLAVTEMLIAILSVCSKEELDEGQVECKCQTQCSYVFFFFFFFFFWTGFLTSSFLTLYQCLNKKPERLL
jgi:hypothetical protein